MVAHDQLPSNLQIPATCSGIVEDSNGDPMIVPDVRIPECRPGTLLVQTIAVALMPADYKTGHSFPTPGAGIGMDFVGRIAKLGSSETDRFSLGEIVCGGVPGSYPGQPWSGAFAAYVLAPADLVFRVPTHISPLEAVSMPTPLLTCSIALWGPLSSLKLKGTPLSRAAPEDSRFVLVYGASSTCGTMAIQLLRLSGHKPIAICSSRNFDLVKAFGAVATFDRSTVQTGELVRNYTSGKLRHALDCITDEFSARCCYEALGRPGGQYASLENCPDKWKTRSIVKSDFVMAIEACGIECCLTGPYYRPASIAKHREAVELHQVFQNCLEMKIIKPHPIEVVGHTWEDVLKGLDRLQKGAVSGTRLVVALSEKMPV